MFFNFFKFLKFRRKQKNMPKERYKNKHVVRIVFEMFFHYVKGKNKKLKIFSQIFLI